MINHDHNAYTSLISEKSLPLVSMVDFVDEGKPAQTLSAVSHEMLLSLIGQMQPMTKVKGVDKIAIKLTLEVIA